MPPRAALQHTIMTVTDVDATAALLRDVVGLEARPRWGRFLPLETTNGVLLDLAAAPAGEAVPPQHYAFMVSKPDFDAGVAALRARGCPFWAHHTGAGVGAVNTLWGGRGVYFRDGTGHLLELLTVPYGPRAELELALAALDEAPSPRPARAAAS